MNYRREPPLDDGMDDHESVFSTCCFITGLFKKKQLWGNF